MRNEEEERRQESGHEARGRAKVRPLVVGIVLGMGLAVVIALTALFIFVRGDTPRLSGESLTAAIKRWDQHGPKSYRLVVAVSGARGGDVSVEVRNGEPASVVRDGRTPPRHTWDFWTVPGQFEAIEMELTGDPQSMFGVPRRSDVIQRAEFDAQYGYPRKYQRQVLGKSLDVGWEVVRFEVIEDSR